MQLNKSIYWGLFVSAFFAFSGVNAQSLSEWQASVLFSCPIKGRSTLHITSTGYLQDGSNYEYGEPERNAHYYFNVWNAGLNHDSCLEQAKSLGRFRAVTGITEIGICYRSQRQSRLGVLTITPNGQIYVTNDRHRTYRDRDFNKPGLTAARTRELSFARCLLEAKMLGQNAP